MRTNTRANDLRTKVFFTPHRLLHRIWIYILLKNKKEAAALIKTCYLKEVRSRNYTIGCLFSDQGGEFKGDDFTQWLLANGINQKFTAGYSPQQNGKVERKNRTVVELTTANLMAASMPLRWFADAASTAWYVLQRTKIVRDTVKKQPLSASSLLSLLLRNSLLI